MTTVNITFNLTEREHELLCRAHGEHWHPHSQRIKGMLLHEAARVEKRNIDDVLTTFHAFDNLPEGRPVHPDYASAIAVPSIQPPRKRKLSKEAERLKDKIARIAITSGYEDERYKDDPTK